jgi:hypothetical protein
MCTWCVSKVSVLIFYLIIYWICLKLQVICRSQWPRGLRRRSTAACLLRMWVRIPSLHGCLSVVSDACVQVEVSATSWSLVQRSPTESVRRCVWSWNLVYEEALAQWGAFALKTNKCVNWRKISFCLMQKNYDKSIAGVEVGHDVFLILPLDEYE